ncbi:glycosyl hydrolase family 88 [Sphingomonas gei]|uniref:Glycosyl hydrolase family 88 n=1 Tax=Sphingomonas gei TaxID=1395960 RepID=A0A4S1XHH5_9SPHN|nr:glycoside hydrolase family 88 protein [Sphingomonas gei]TGX55193.1 glycosyl hydrolase family 88 [Sphingomonas gei]
MSLRNALLLLATIGALPGAALAQAAAEVSPRAAVDAATKLARWQLARMRDTSHISRAGGETGNPRAWEQAAFWVGMTALADHGAPADIGKAILDMGRANQWQPGRLPFFADDHAITQSYLWAAKHGADPDALRPVRRVFDNVVDNAPRVTLAFVVPEKGGYGATECLARWCWCDALFMAPPAMLELSNQTGDRRYRDYALREVWATVNFLYDPAERLFYRDSRFFDRRDAKGRKMFWSRGNGWVLAGLALMIPKLPKGDPDRRKLEALFVEMAGKVKATQKADGFWAPSLLAPEDSPPESSGTGFYTFGLAWGIKAGLLPRAEYAPAVRKGWVALARSIQPDGRLGWVQQVSDRPEQVLATDTQYYGVGAFLLAATAVADLKLD